MVVRYVDGLITHKGGSTSGLRWAEARSKKKKKNLHLPKICSESRHGIRRPFLFSIGRCGKFSSESSLRTAASSERHPASRERQPAAPPPDPTAASLPRCHQIKDEDDFEHDFQEFKDEPEEDSEVKEVVDIPDVKPFAFTAKVPFSRGTRMIKMRSLQVFFLFGYYCRLHVAFFSKNFSLCL